MSHPDPHVRLLAHVSERQLQLFEMFNDHMTIAAKERAELMTALKSAETSREVVARHLRDVEGAVSMGFRIIGDDIDDLREARGLSRRGESRLTPVLTLLSGGQQSGPLEQQG